MADDTAPSTGLTLRELVKLAEQITVSSDQISIRVEAYDPNPEYEELREQTFDVTSGVLTVHTSGRAFITLHVEI